MISLASGIGSAAISDCGWRHLPSEWGGPLLGQIARPLQQARRETRRHFIARR